MPHYFYYLILAAIGLAIAAFVFYKEKNRYKLLIFFLFSATIADSGEVLVLLILNAYSYHLGIFSDPAANSILAHLILNNTLWPAAAIFVAAYSPRLRWIISVSVIFVLLDILFVQLGLYQHVWWAYWMSGVAVFVYCIIMRFWYAKLDDHKFKILRFLTFSFVFSLVMFMPTSMLILTDQIFYNVGIFANIHKDSILFSFLLHSALGPLCTLLICVLKKWYWKLVPFILFISIDLLLVSFDILYIADSWHILYSAAIHIISLLIYIWLENKYSYKPK
jgi:hypothetical protein